MKNNKRYKISKEATCIMVILTVVCILAYVFCTIQIKIDDNIGTNKILVYETVKSILLVIISVTGLNLLSSILIEVKSKNSYLSEIMANDVVAAPEFYDCMDVEKKEKMYNALEKSLYFKYDITHEMYKSIRNKLKENLDEYYYTDCSYSVSCAVFDNYIEKEVTRTTKIRSYEKNCYTNGFYIGNFTSKKIAGLKASEVKSIEINGKRIESSDINIVDSKNRNNLDEQNEYNYSVDYIYKKKLKFTSNTDTIITMKYITRTSNDDRMSTFRVGHPCKKFTLFYSVKQHEQYRIVVNAYGFLDDADNSNNNSSKSDITITFNDWIFKHDGVTVVMLDK